MKKVSLLIISLLGLPVFCLAQQLTVGKITASTTRMSPQTLMRHFPLKPGDNFDAELFDKAQDDLHRLRVFKKLSFSTTPSPENKVDIHIDAEDGSYIFPMAFLSGGNKNAAGVSLAAGNLFKQGESSFFFVGGSTDGFSAAAGAVLADNSLSIHYSKLNFDQRFYSHYWSNTYGVFSTTDDEKEYASALLGSVHTKKESVSLIYTRRFNRVLRAFVKPQYIYYSYGKEGFDGGLHNQIQAGLRWTDDIRPGANMGALSGYGLTDKTKSLQDLPRARSGYMAEVAYSAGGSWTGSDYTLSKLQAEAAWILETKSRHLFVLEAKAADAFKASFSDEIFSTDLLSGAGRYDRHIRGSRGAGTAATWIYYILRNKTGLLSLAPFYEIAYVYTDGAYRPHSGAGATLTYKLWRFPLPVGINYTHNLQDGSNQIGFVVGGTF